MGEVPEINGKPAAKLHVQFEEKVGFPNYSNVTYGTSLTRYVEDDKKTILAERKEMEKSCESWLEDYRENVGEMLKAATS
jgi:hypothetical protein